MKGQARPHLCGPAAVANALEMYGRRPSRARVARLAGTTSEGSDHHDLILAIDALGFTPAEFETGRRAEARAWLLSLSPIAPLILAVDRWAHWITVIGQGAGGRLLVADGEAAEVVTPARPTRLLARWRATRAQRGDGERYYGIAVIR